MRYSFIRSGSARNLLAATSIALCCVSGTALANDGPVPSKIMPKAKKSLLLDIERQGDRLFMVGDRGHILYSTDKGDSWTQVQAPMSQLLTAVDFASDKKGWAVGHDGHILHTRDGGDSWVLQRNGLKAQAEINEQKLKNARAELKRLETLRRRERAGEDITEALAAGLYSRGYDNELLSLDEQIDEVQWQIESAQSQLQETVVAPPLMNVSFANDNEGWAVGAFGTLLKTDNGGDKWRNVARVIDNRRNYHLNDVQAYADGVVLIAGEGGYLLRSDDHGQSWQQIDLGAEATLFDLIAEEGSDTVVVAGLRGTAFKSADRGKTWQAMAPGVDYSLAGGALKDDYLVLAGAGGSVAVSTDRGKTFSRHTLPSRSSLTQAVVVEQGVFLLVGQGGVHRFDINTAVEK